MEGVMRATEILMQEHRVIERVLDALEAAAHRAERGEPMRPMFFADAADFIRGFADRCHHQKEEGVLFKAMESAGMPTQAGPIAVMLTEHEQGRAFTRSMLAAAERWENGDEAARSDAATAAKGYVALLRDHILKEDNVLFPMAAQVIPTGKHGEVTAEVERVEEEETGAGVHEKYLALARKLENEVKG
jgi:hemerythrin-like domain-containing protein